MAVAPSHNSSILIIGASARAAAFSALRAGLSPWCGDLFADLDLQARCFFQRLRGPYPVGFGDMIASDVGGPWMYTGGLENYPTLIDAWQDQRPLWGIHSDSLDWARDPVRIARILYEAGLPTPKTVAQPPLDATRRWLIKPRRRSGGNAVQEWYPNVDAPAQPGIYWQEFIEGQPAAALYAAMAGEVQLLGLTRQLIGVSWLHADYFRYCGSIGPLQPPPEMRRELIRIGGVLGSRCSLSGLFGVDGILGDGHFWPIEVNPRYTASVEVLEYASGLQALAWHRRAFDCEAHYPQPPPKSVGFVGKAILFAPHDLTFPAVGPWLSELQSPTALHVTPDFADIPAAGEVIRRGEPILTFFVHKAKLGSCEDALQAIAEDLTRQLYPNESSNNSRAIAGEKAP